MYVCTTRILVVRQAPYGAIEKAVLC
eukprot:COSAG05_NODE_24721_length_227_cov_158.078125_2_plen_25_part_01